MNASLMIQHAPMKVEASVQRINLNLAVGDAGERMLTNANRLYFRAGYRSIKFGRGLDDPRPHVTLRRSSLVFSRNGSAGVGIPSDFAERWIAWSRVLTTSLLQLRIHAPKLETAHGRYVIARVEAIGPSKSHLAELLGPETMSALHVTVAAASRRGTSPAPLPATHRWPIITHASRLRISLQGAKGSCRRSLAEFRPGWPRAETSLKSIPSNPSRTAGDRLWGVPR